MIENCSTQARKIFVLHDKIICDEPMNRRKKKSSSPIGHDIIIYKCVSDDGQHTAQRSRRVQGRPYSCRYRYDNMCTSRTLSSCSTRESGPQRTATCTARWRAQWCCSNRAAAAVYVFYSRMIPPIIYHRAAFLKLCFAKLRGSAEIISEFLET